MKMIVEQTYAYKARMEYDKETNTFHETNYLSIMYDRGFKYPYGWIKESGTPPEPHCDCILICEEHFELGDEVDVKIIGMFKRADGDHKYIVSKIDSKCDDYEQLSAEEREALKRLYPRIGKGEGWFGKEEALYCYENCEHAL